MTIDALATATTTAPPRPAALQRSAALGSDFQMFLRMLTAQMQNQDPLNPLQSTDFAVQLATFAGVEQQTRTNQLLEALQARSGAGALAPYAGWIGMEARTTDPVRFEGAPLALEPDLPPGADAVVLVVRDAAGREVAREPLPPGGGPVAWAGTDATGAPLAPGLYTFRAEGYDDSVLIADDPVPVHVRVTEVRTRPDGVVELVLLGGTRVAADAVTGLRAPPG